MKKLILFFFLIPFYHMAQEEFSFKLYFEDANGQLDTVVVGYDPNATQGIDAALGEIDILNQPWRNTMEVRLGNLVINQENLLVSGHYVPAYNAINYSKKQIIKKDCSEFGAMTVNIYFLLLKNVEFPLTISWDGQSVLNSCTNRNFITDWFPGGWFDYPIIGTEQLPFDMNVMNAVELQYISLHNVDVIDTTQLLFVSMSNSTLSTKPINDYNFEIINNPFENTFSLQENIEESQIQIFDFQGKEINFIKTENKITPLNCSKGFYLIKVEKNGLQYYQKIMKL